MQNQNDALLYRGATYRYLLTRFKALFLNLIYHPYKLIIFVSYIFFLVMWINKIELIGKNLRWLKKYELYLEAGLVLVFITIFLILLLSSYFKDLIFRRKIYRIGLTNSLSEPPLLLLNKKRNGILEMHFDSEGVTLDEWDEKIPDIENVFNITIASISTGRRTKNIIVQYVKGKHGFDKTLYWHPHNLTSDGTILLGESFGSKVSVSFDDYPHFLIGGGTGSGKTVLLKLILMQCINKDYEVIISDYKGGVDYRQIWHNKCKFVCTDDDTLAVLKHIDDERKERTVILKSCNASNIYEYNAKHNLKIKDIVFTCDELAELFDVAGLSKEEKSKKQEIARYVSSIARLGRAFGIHLILATQRPDADVLNGQIKNNIGYRICGRADDVLSRIILDNSSASDRVPKDGRGVFINHEGIVFKSYLFDENKDIH